MTDNIENLVLEHLKASRNELRDFRTKTEDEFQDLSLRFSEQEQNQANLYQGFVRQQATIDQVRQRLDRIERRLELHDNTI
jgi:uncharacterized coiled-coil protein SlyX